MAPEVSAWGGRGHAPASPWSPMGVASIVAAGVVALAGLYLRGGELFTQSTSSPAASQIVTYCYESITTLAEGEPVSGPQCFTVKDGHFTAVVPYSEAQGTSSTILKGHVIPGLWDGHGHLIPYGEFLASADLFGSSDATDVRHRLHEYLAQHPDVGGHDKWLRGFGWDQMAMGGMPTADLLESEGLSGLYIMLDRVDAHCIWVSQAVLDLLPEDLLDVPGGEIVRDPGLGVFCDNAMNLVLNQYPKPSKATKTEYIRLAMRQMRSMGLVGMHDAGVVPEDLQLYQELAGSRHVGGPGHHSDKDDGWTMRVYAMVECAERNTFCVDDVAVLRQQEGRSEFLSIRSVKLFADGALGSWGSAMIEPYSDRPETRGSLLVDAATLMQLTHDWAAAGFQVNIHAIGDLANRYAIDAFESALVQLCQPPAGPLADCQREQFRFRIEHAQIIHPHDQARIHALGIVPSIQPTHATSDMTYATRRLGLERTRDEAYRMQSFLKHGTKFVLGSDFPIEPPDPFQGIYAAVARRSPHTGLSANGTKEPWYPDEALTLDEALDGFTQGPAYGGFLKGRAGVIQEGALADWVVLDKSLAEYDIEELRSMKVRETWVGGTRVYERERADRTFY
ncbi:hypothetical protein SEUCBS139899_007249 [Sporothrix eucalyptigena]|uniref:Amidohydrolase 3 domain-containing protein n=1 Tax=Sporothrix eucalyptigena TaxID=1812306 RepID=A0ABP0B6T5_9PEZI